MHCHDFDLMKGPQSVFCSLGLLTLQGTLKHRHTTLVTSQRRTVQKRAGSKTCLVLAAACQPPYRFVDCLTTQASPILRGSQISKPSSRVFQETWSVSTFFGVDRPSGRYSPRHWKNAYGRTTRLALRCYSRRGQCVPAAGSSDPIALQAWKIVAWRLLSLGRSRLHVFAPTQQGLRS